MTIDLTDHFQRVRLTRQIAEDIEAYSVKAFQEDPRTHLGASIIGDSCTAKSWNVFRWLKAEQFSGRMYRLFNRGHGEEHRIVRWLRGIGFEIHEVDPQTQNQFRISASKGHFGGSLDGIARAPSHYNLPHDLILVTEFKTHSEDSFTKLAGKLNKATYIRSNPTGVQLAKPMHFRQMSVYGRACGYKYGLYVAVNKNTDEIYLEIVELDWHIADDLFRKADQVIFSQERPSKIANSETFSDCKYCNFKGLCHGNEVPDKNCRSCVNAFPIDNGQWVCKHWNNIVPADFILKGCDQWKRIA
jgi:hypothetical protein